MDTPLLSYQFSTAPIPLQVSPDGSQTTSRISLAVFNPTPGVYCSQIMVAVPVGTTATDFCVAAPSASVNTGKWTIASLKVVPGHEIGEESGSYATIIFQCRDADDYKLGYSLVLSLTGVVNSTVGTFSYSIQELTGPSPDQLTSKVSKHAISKQDAIFTLRNFAATAAGAPTVPATRFGNGQGLQLSWDSNGTWFQLYANGSPAPRYAGPATSYSLPAGLTADTQFVLVASVSGDPSQDSPSPGYQPIYLYDALTLVVSNPDLTPKSITAESDIATQGAVTAGQLTTGGASVSGQLTVAGATTLSGPATVSGTAKVSGTTEFTAPVTFRADVSAVSWLTGNKASIGTISGQEISAAKTLSAPTVSAGTLQSSSGGSPLIRDDNGHTWLLKWVGQQGNDLVAQLYMWDNSQRWGGLKLPVLGYKTFVVDHPLDPDRYLVHATLEGPEPAVYYRGTGQLAGGRTEVCLPDYADALTDPDSWTVQLTPIGGFDRLAVEPSGGRCVRDGRFVVVADNPESAQEFGWEAKGTRRDQGSLEAEPVRLGLDVHAMGPYTFAVPRDQPQSAVD